MKIGLAAGCEAFKYFRVTSDFFDEYEVARLHTETGFLEKIKTAYRNKAKVKFHLAPPLFARGDNLIILIP